MLNGTADSFAQDVRYALRQLKQSPGFTLVAVLSLALGIGANTAIFQLVDAVRLRTLPVTDPQELVAIDFAPGSTRAGWFSTRSARLTSAQYEQVLAHNEPFSSISAFSLARFNLAPAGEVRFIDGMYVSGSFFGTVGVPAQLGRVFLAEDDQPACSSPGAILSAAFWQREFGSAQDVIGKTVTLDGRRFPIIGVSPPAFFGVEVGKQVDVYLPMCADKLMASDGKGRASERNAWWLSALARLKPGWTYQRATAYLETASPAITQASLPPTYRPDLAKRYLKNKLAAQPGGTGSSLLRRQYETPLWILLATTGLVLVIACANLANLLLARASMREREIAIRMAIGASRSQLIRQLLIESLLLATAGALLGIALAQALSRTLIAFLSTENNPLFVGLGMDLRILGFTTALALTTCLLFGLMPAFRATRTSASSAMRASGRGSTAGRERHGLRKALVVTQVALSLVLLFGALLFTGSLRNLLSVNPGFTPEGVIVARTDFAHASIPKEQRLETFRQLRQQIGLLPGVVSVSEVGITPISGSNWNQRVHKGNDTGEGKDVNMNRVSPNYFATMRTNLLSGRDFTDRDNLGGPKVAIVNEEFAKQVMGGANVVGQTFRYDGEAGKPDPVFEIVGVVRNSKHIQLREPDGPIAYFPIAQDDDPDSGAQYVIRAQGSPSTILLSLKNSILERHPLVQIDFRILSTQLNQSLLREKLMASLSGAFAGLAAFLATLGLYGVIAYMVQKRRNEIGIRMALGADRYRVIRLVLREATVLLAVGVVIGVGLAIWAGQAASAMLYGLQPHDVGTLSLTVCLLAGVTLAASYLPARRASRVDPMIALRDE